LQGGANNFHNLISLASSSQQFGAPVNIEINKTNKGKKENFAELIKKGLIKGGVVATHKS